MATISQVYSNEIRSFRIVDSGRTLAIAGYRAVRDPVNFRRRDGNLVNFVGVDGRAELAFLGGGPSARSGKTAPGSRTRGHPVDRARLREDGQHHVEQALRLRASASVLGAGEDEATAGDLVVGLAGLAGHGVEQVAVGHGAISWESDK
jgi:hypothetical protein